MAGPSRTSRRAPARLPECDNSVLIAANKLTLLGRVTNPSIQRPKAVVDYFIQFWNLESTVTGRDLGLEMFQFRFETEEPFNQSSVELRATLSGGCLLFNAGNRLFPLPFQLLSPFGSRSMEFPFTTGLTKLSEQLVLSWVSSPVEM